MKLYMKSIIILSAITIVGVGGYFVWKYMHAPKQDTAKQEKLTAAELLEQSLDTEEITTNFNDGGFIKAKFKIVTTSKDKAEELTKLQFRLESAIIQYINEINKKDVNGPEGIMKIENNLKTVLNKELGEKDITRVYMIDKMVQ